MSAPCASASAIGRAPRYADANSGSAGERVERLAGVEVRERLAVLGVQRVEPAEHVVAETVAIVMPVTPIACAVSIAACAAAVGLMPPAFVMTFVRPSATYGNARARYAGRSRV